MRVGSPRPRQNHRRAAGGAALRRRRYALASRPRLPALRPNRGRARRAGHDPYLALRYGDFRLLIIGTSIGALGEQMLTVAVGWDLYARTNSALMLGLAGLAQFAPALALSLVAGHTADHYDRRRIIMLSQALITLTSAGLAAVALTQAPVGLVFALLAARGMGEAFNVAASGALPPQTVPVEAFESASSWSSATWQVSAVLGPALGGVVIALRGTAAPVYIFDALAGLAFIATVARIRGRQVARVAERMSVEGLMAGVRFILRTKVILAAITLDMVAVLLGGATTLLPVFATTILHVGPAGLGVMAAAPSVGALLMAGLQAYLPPWRHAGRTLLLAVGGFGVATLIFGLSRNFALSLAVLFALGALDNISVVIRKTLLLVRTPDVLRGRLSAVNNVFVGASNQLGGFESGVTAAALGPALAVALGGIGSVLAVIAIAWAWPELRDMGRLTAIERDQAGTVGEPGATDLAPASGMASVVE